MRREAEPEGRASLASWPRTDRLGPRWGRSCFSLVVRISSHYVVTGTSRMRVHQMSPSPQTPACGSGCIAHCWLPLGPDSIQQVLLVQPLKNTNSSWNTVGPTWGSALPLLLALNPTTLAICLQQSPCGFFHSWFKRRGVLPCPTDVSIWQSSITSCLYLQLHQKPGRDGNWRPAQTQAHAHRNRQEDLPDGTHPWVGGAQVGRHAL